MSLLGLLVTLIILGIIAWLIFYLVGLLQIPQPFKTAIIVVLVLICILILIGMIPGSPYWLSLPRR